MLRGLLMLSVGAAMVWKSTAMAFADAEPSAGKGVREILKHSPAFSLLTLQLEPGRSIIAEAGAMVCMQDVEVQTQFAVDSDGGGGCFGSIGRAVLGDQTLFTNTFTGKDESGGWISLAPTAAGDIAIHYLAPDRELYIQRGSFLGCWSNVQTEMKYKGLKGLFSGEGLFFVKAFSRDAAGGKVYMSSYGALEKILIKKGQTVTVDSGHIVAYEDSVTYRIGKIGDVKSFFLGGEGFVCHFEVLDRGPRTRDGFVWVQTRDFSNQGGMVRQIMGA